MYRRPHGGVLTKADTVLSLHDIMASNVRPAFEASLALGVSEAELERALGWRRDELEQEGAIVSGASTYRHMELMHQRADYPRFVLEAARRYSLSSLGIVGLACKTTSTVSEALALHQRYQRLTNRSASYRVLAHDDELVIEETREDPSLGSQLISEYTLFIAAHLLNSAAAQAPRIHRMETRRAMLSAPELQAFEDHLEAPLTLAAPRARLVLDARLLHAPLRAADKELEAYFQELLTRAMPTTHDEALLIAQVRRAIQHALPHADATLNRVAADLGLGPRTLQRRLLTHGLKFGQLLEQTRRALAQSYLREPERTLLEITYLLGYSEQAAFTRAFKRWYQTTPAAWREVDVKSPKRAMS